MNINWSVRLKNKAFWVAIIPAVLLLVQQVGAVFGVTFTFAVLQDQIIAIVGTVFSVLTILGVVIDPTTDGVGDSTQAMTYTEPKKTDYESA
ncbi:phage holin [Adlercreutzia sp. ZJ141]|uniref:phage holin n=1 Tax=Adlercreutzia sp. ZJ141 TaxID=2709406 RepID=UPI0013EB0CC6|nr:phage holin [Adlercreutzia sp. ZJ141]